MGKLTSAIRVLTIKMTSNDELLTKIVLEEQKDYEVVRHACARIRNQENLALIARARMGLYNAALDREITKRFSIRSPRENRIVSEFAISYITDVSILLDLAERVVPPLQTAIARQMRPYPEACAKMALAEYKLGMSGCHAYADMVTRPDLVKSILCGTSHGTVAQLAADRMTDAELFETLLTDAIYFPSKNISGGKYDARPFAAYLFDRFNSAADLQKLAESAASETLRGQAKKRLEQLGK